MLAPHETEEGWDAVAAAYEERLQPQHEAFVAGMLKLAPPPSDGGVLDVGCGPGGLTWHAAALGSAVNAVDFSARMVELVAKRASLTGERNVRAYVMPAEALDFEDGRFDAAYSSFGAIYSPDRPRVWAELHRVLAPGGAFAASAWTLPPENGYMGLVGAATRRAFNDPSTGPMPRFLELADADVFRAELAAAGFLDVEVRDLQHPFRFGDADALMTTAITTSPTVHGLWGILDEPERRGLQAAFRETVTDVFGARPIEVPVTARIALARK